MSSVKCSTRILDSDNQCSGFVLNVDVILIFDNRLPPLRAAFVHFHFCGAGETAREDVEEYVIGKGNDSRNQKHISKTSDKSRQKC
jgi:hypothetical protein